MSDKMENLGRILTDDAVKAVEEGRGSEVRDVQFFAKLENFEEYGKVLCIGFSDPYIYLEIIAELKRSNMPHLRGVSEGLEELLLKVIGGSDAER